MDDSKVMSSDSSGERANQCGEENNLTDSFSKLKCISFGKIKEIK